MNADKLSVLCGAGMVMPLSLEEMAARLLTTLSDYKSALNNAEVNKSDRLADLEKAKQRIDEMIEQERALG